MVEGDQVWLLDKRNVALSVVDHQPQPENKIKVYNFEVQDWHTYFVGWWMVLVHNNAIDCLKESVSRIWEVGIYNKLRGVEEGLQAHHVGQKHLMSEFVSGYNPAHSPSILVPEIGHTRKMPDIGRIATTKGSGKFENARQVLARDIIELRRVYGSQGIPNSALQELIQLNKTMYPNAFIK